MDGDEDDVLMEDVVDMEAMIEELEGRTIHKTVLDDDDSQDSDDFFDGNVRLAEYYRRGIDNL